SAFACTVTSENIATAMLATKPRKRFRFMANNLEKLWSNRGVLIRRDGSIPFPVILSLLRRPAHAAAIGHLVQLRSMNSRKRRRLADVVELLDQPMQVIPLKRDPLISVALHGALAIHGIVLLATLDNA